MKGEFYLNLSHCNKNSKSINNIGIEFPEQKVNEEKVYVILFEVITTLLYASIFLLILLLI